MKQNSILLAVAAGVFSPNYFPVLPPTYLIWAVGVVAGLMILLLFYVRRRPWPLVFFTFLLAGLAWGLYQANKLDAQLLSAELDAEIFTISARVNAVEERGGSASGGQWEVRVQRLELTLEEVHHAGGKRLELHPKKVLVSWYGKEIFQVGNRLVAEAKLRRPRGLKNHGLFDYQRWLVAEGVGATGYIRELISLDSDHSGASSFVNWRNEQVSTNLRDSGLSYSGIHRALALGDSADIDPEIWELFRETGTIHLLVISGLHVGLVAGLGYLLGFGLGRCLSPAFRMNGVRTGILCSLGAAFCYCAISGFGLPATRALIMLAALLLPRYFYLNTSRWFGLSLALAAISILEPQATLSPGFWLSFGAVLILFIGFHNHGKQHFVVSLVRTQLLFLSGFFGVLLWQGAEVPLASFAANLITVPLISLGVVPLEILAITVSFVSDWGALQVWKLCDWLVGWVVTFLEYLTSMGLPSLRRPAEWVAVHYIAVLSAFVIWTAPGRYLRLALAVGCMPLLFPKEDSEYILKIRIFDVGQGQAVLIQQPGYQIIYDTGPRFSENFDAGADILLPSLQQMRVSKLDKLIVSHPDADHRGGFEGLVSELDVKRLEVGKPFDSQLNSDHPIQQYPCRQGMSWQQEELSYQYLWPAATKAYSDNDSSCVLLIRGPNINVLIPGDISAWVESRLVTTSDEIRDLDLLLVPHHGSKTSSSISFVEKLAPNIAVISSGYKNRFHHPHPQVVERYVDQGSQILNTAETGTIEIVWRTKNMAPDVILAADSKIFWWQK